MKSLILNSAKQFNEDVKSGNYPNDDEVFKLDEEELRNLTASLQQLEQTKD